MLSLISLMNSGIVKFPPAAPDVVAAGILAPTVGRVGGTTVSWVSSCGAVSRTIGLRGGDCATSFSCTTGLLVGGCAGSCAAVWGADVAAGVGVGFAGCLSVTAGCAVGVAAGIGSCTG